MRVNGMSLAFFFFFFINYVSHSHRDQTSQAPVNDKHSKNGMVNRIYGLDLITKFRAISSRDFHFSETLSKFHMTGFDSYGADIYT